jgi:SAM-dependent methyltransferase
VLFADLAAVGHGQSALDVGCGPGALTAELALRLGDGAVRAVDPSVSFAAAVRQRLPGVAVAQAIAEQLPFDDGVFDVVMAQLVVHFMTDPVAGLTEMGRVARPGGTIAACVWDFAGGRGPLSLFWRAATELDPGAPDESRLAGTRHGQLTALLAAAGAGRVRETALEVHARYPSFDQWWEPYTLGVGPAGAYLASLSPGHRAALRGRCRDLLPAGPVRVEAFAWAAAGRA